MAVISEIRKLRSDLHSEWKLGEFDEDITRRTYDILYRSRFETPSQLNKVLEWINSAIEARVHYKNWVRYRDKLEMAIIELGHIKSNDTWKDYPKRGEF